ncbi:MAG: hypothetical protein UZ11_BCD004000030 [Bacteroidetes bacterium OLB11]|nr:MAG: hypothetical protein UZ11_BCD004000030 [Bacteroidetes bacterium OLB11]
MVINNIGEVCGREFKYFIEILKLKRNIKTHFLCKITT